MQSARRPELRAGSVAAIILDRARRGPVLRRTSHVPADDSPTAIVLRPPARLGPANAGVAVMAAVVVAAMGLVEGPASTPAPATRPRVLQAERVVELPPPVAEPSPAASTPAPVTSRARRAAARPAAAAPAAAGKVIAAPAAQVPVDFTSMIAGETTAFAGGATASSGTSTAPAPVASRGEAGRVHAAASRARPVRLAASEWDCPWPRQAEALSIREQVVVLRAVVRADGSVASAVVLIDPGHGFGDSALRCAQARRLVPATDERGVAILATSPALRVTFRR